MEHLNQDRRNFLKSASLAFALPLILGCRSDSTAAQQRGGDVLSAIKKNAINDPSNEWWGALDAPADVSWKTLIAPAADKGERIVISGTVYGADGKTPAPDTLIYLYHTDVHGIYGRGGEHRHGRYRGWMLTDAKGRYEFESILPASYPNSTISKHIHMTVTTASSKEDWIDSVLFEGDPYLTARERVAQRGGPGHVVKLEKRADGRGHAVRDLRLA